MRIEPVKLEHFVSFITSPHVIQDVPFGEKLLKLSTGAIIKHPMYQKNDTRALYLRAPATISTMSHVKSVMSYRKYCVP